MKKSILLLLSLCFALTIQSQTIHWLTFIDTNDPKVGDTDKNSQALLFSRFRNVVNAALSTAGYKADNQEFFGERMTPQNCKDAIKSLNCGKDDIIMFYYIGHGTHARNEDNPYPQMMFGKDWDEEKEFIPLKLVHDNLKAKGARLTISIGMCCNPIQSASAKKTITFANSPFTYNYGSTYLSDLEIERILSLFLNNEGDIIQASAKVGEVSWGWPFMDMGDIDTFTRFLILQFEELMKEGKTPTWHSFLEEVCNNVSMLQKQIVSEMPRLINEASQGGFSPYQTPFNDINITSCNRPSHAPLTMPELDEEISLYELIDVCLAILSDKSLPYAERKKFSEEFCSLFSANSIVQTISQDMDIVIDKDNPEKFIQRVITSPILVDVQLVDLQTDTNGGIIELNVREFYKETNE